MRILWGLHQVFREGPEVFVQALRGSDHADGFNLWGKDPADSHAQLVEGSLLPSCDFSAIGAREVGRGDDMGAVIRDKFTHVLYPNSTQGVHQGMGDQGGPQEGRKLSIVLVSRARAPGGGRLIGLSMLGELYAMLLHYAQLPEARVEPGLLIRDLFHCCIAPVGAALDVQESGRD